MFSHFQGDGFSDTPGGTRHDGGLSLKQFHVSEKLNL
jgi:hypothetical protein